jgi:hypothetical protein
MWPLKTSWLKASTLTETTPSRIKSGHRRLKKTSDQSSRMPLRTGSTGFRMVCCSLTTSSMMSLG